jgi:hypothetical protein
MRNPSSRIAIILITAIALFAHQSNAQVVKIDTLTHWKKAFRMGLNLNQASSSANWKAGAVNSLGFNALLNYKANYKNGVHSWDNEIDFLYGMVSNEGQGTRKTLDRIFLDTRYGRAINSKWDLSVSANLLSQFSAGFNYVKDPVTGIETSSLISGLFAPAYITAALGFEYHPAEYFKLRLSPLSPRVTIVNEVNRFVTVANPTPYGVQPNESTFIQWYAFQMLAEFNKDIAPNLNLKWRYILFADYKTLELNKIDQRLDLDLTARVNKFVNVSIGGIAMYFYNQDKDIQFSQALSLGVAYSFQNFADKK